MTRARESAPAMHHGGRMRRTLLMLATTWLGCAEYAYLPVENATAELNGQTAAVYAVPPEAPQGDVRIASFGVVPLQMTAGEKVKALHVRMLLANRGDALWTLDTREQLCAIAGEGQSRPIFANTDAGEPPLVNVPPKSQRALDLFYPLPYGMQDASLVPGFALSWQLSLAGRAITKLTAFERMTVEPRTAVYVVAYDRPGWWGPYWWYDPVYVDLTYRHPYYYGRGPIVVAPRYVGPPRGPHIHHPPPPIVHGRPPVIVHPPSPQRHR
jgi:hypothetical protein